MVRRLESCQTQHNDRWSNTFLKRNDFPTLSQHNSRLSPCTRNAVFAAPRHGPKVHVWGGKSERGLTVLKIFKTNMDSHLYNVCNDTFQKTGQLEIRVQEILQAER